MSQKKKIAVIGCGTLGSIFLNLSEQFLSDQYEITGILTRTGEPKNEFSPRYHFYRTIDELVVDAPDYAVEFASAQAVTQYGKYILEKGIHLVLVSIGALADSEVYQALKVAAQTSGAKLYVSPGAIGGFDIMRTMTLCGNAKLTVINQKSPEGLAGAPALLGKELSKTQKQLIFRGNASEAIRQFPKNVNVAVAASIAASDVERAVVEVWSIPGLPENTHRICVETELGRAEMEFASKPDRENPRSSVITAWSTVALLNNLASPVQFF